MYSYMSQFFGGSLDPTWPHAVLIAGTIVGGVLVGLGVILEAPKLLSIPVAAVFVGVVVEAACTLLLFGFDEGISGAQQSRIEAQQSKIIALETRLSARNLTSKQQSAIALAASAFPNTKFDVAAAHGQEPLDLLAKIEDSLITAHWVEVIWTGADIIRVGRQNAGTAITEGIEIEVEPTQESGLLPIAKALAEAISDQGVAAVAKFANTNMPSTNHTAIHVIVGTKP